MVPTIIFINQTRDVSDTTNREMDPPAREGVTETQESNLPLPLTIHTQVSQALTERRTPAQTLRSSRVTYSSIELLAILNDKYLCHAYDK